MCELKVSYLQARDPSLVSYSRANLNKMQINFDSTISDVEDQSEILQETTEEDTKHVNVYLRIKQKDETSSSCYQIENNSLVCRRLDGVKRIYDFTKIFDSYTKQDELFNCVIKPKILSFINSKNYSLFAYGTSGSGKTFTIVGTPEQPGIIPRAIEYIFKSISKVNVEPIMMPLPNGDLKEIDDISKLDLFNKKSGIINAPLLDQSEHMETFKQIQARLSSETVAQINENSGVSANIWISFCEIYNEKIYDLLAPPVTNGESRTKLVLGKNGDETYIKHLTYLSVSNGIEAYQILQYGLQNLKYAATAVNLHSSRSHCIFTVKLIQSSGDNENILISNFNFCDLAGSERSKKTLNSGVRLKESNNINSSLLVLGRCIEKVREKQQSKDHLIIPFRDSKLTQIFQKSLMGHERLEMIVNINSSEIMINETIHTLNFSAIAKDIIIEKCGPRIVRKPTRFSLMVEMEDKKKREKKNFEREEESESIIRQLKKELERVYSKLRDYNEDYENLYKQYEEIIDERDDIMEKWREQIIEERAFATQNINDMLADNRRWHRKEIQSLKERYEKEIEELQAELEVIVISSSDEEDKSDEEGKVSPQSRNQIKKLKENNLELTKKNNDLARKVLELEEKLKLSKHQNETQEKKILAQQKAILKLTDREEELEKEVAELTKKLIENDHFTKEDLAHQNDLKDKEILRVTIINERLVKEVAELKLIQYKEDKFIDQIDLKDNTISTLTRIKKKLEQEVANLKELIPNNVFSDEDNLKFEECSKEELYAKILAKSTYLKEAKDDYLHLKEENNRLEEELRETKIKLLKSEERCFNNIGFF